MFTPTHAKSRRAYVGLICLLVALLCGAGISSSADAAMRTAGIFAPQVIIVVTTTGDTVDAAGGVCTAITLASLPGPDGVTSLREAVCAANANAGPDTINFSVNGTFTLTRVGSDENASNGDLDILGSLAVSGNGAANTIIDGNLNERVFDTNPTGGATGCPCTFDLVGVTVQRGFATAANFNVGGGVYVGSNFTLNVINSVITNNRAQTIAGGIGINSSTSILNMTGSTVSNNTAEGQGGGVRAPGLVTINTSVITGNTGEQGAGIWLGAAQGVVQSITDSTVSGNHAVDRPGGIPAGQQDGGGVYVSTDGVVSITRSTLSGNDATRNGGGLYTDDSATTGVGTVTMTNSTVSGNTVGDDGGGIYNDDAALSITYSTISQNIGNNDNNGTGNVGGLAHGVATGSATIGSSILAGNRNIAGATTDCSGNLSSGGFNVFGNGVCPVAGSDANLVALGIPVTNVINTTLANNGGPTQTHALVQSGANPAIDNANPSNCPPTDQRGVGRPIGAGCDRGSYEAPLPPTPTNTATVTPTNSPTRTPTATNTNTATSTNTPTVTPTSTSTNTNTATVTPTNTNTATNTPTNTPTFTVTSTSTASNTATATPTNTNTNTATPTTTNTPTSTNTSTNTPTVTPTNTSTSTPTNTSTATRTSTTTNTPSATGTATSTSTATNTATTTATNTNVPTLTSTPTGTLTPTNTFTVTRTSTSTPTNNPGSTATNSVTTTPTTQVTSTGTATSTGVSTNTPTLVPTNTATSGATNTGTVTVVVTGTPTSTGSATSVATGSSTSTATPTGTVFGTATSTVTGTISPSVTPTVCIIKFEDVQPGDWYYEYVSWMFCNNVVSGYQSVPPCAAPGRTCFKPGNNTTRGQMAKIVVLAFGFPIDTTGGPHFSDVQPGHTFYSYVETGRNLGLFSGYPDGTYKPDMQVTRGQIAKIVVNAAILADPANWTLVNPPANTFEDVLPGNVFYQHIETAYAHGVIEGYPCGTLPAGPCVAPDNKPYFLPGANATRAQISKVVYLSVMYPPSR